MNEDNMWICSRCGVDTMPWHCKAEERCPHCYGKMLDTKIHWLEFMRKANNTDYIQHFVETVVIPYGKYDPKEAKRVAKMLKRKIKEADAFEKFTDRNMEKMRQMEADKNCVPKCPSCESTNVVKIGAMGRAFSIGVFGLASSKIGKTHECKNCGTTW